MDLYNAMLAEREGVNGDVRQETLDNGKVQTISGNGAATVQAIALLKEDGTPAEVHGTGSQVNLCIDVAVHADIPELTLGFRIKDRLGQNIFGTNTFHKLAPLNGMKAGDRFRANWRFPLILGPGSYSVATALHSSDNHLGQNYEWRDLALVFEVMNLQHSYFEGSTWLNPDVVIEHGVAQP
jgi:lipopolysaccharide transport system ATP-binding protein